MGPCAVHRLPLPDSSAPRQHGHWTLKHRDLLHQLLLGVTRGSSVESWKGRGAIAPGRAPRVQANVDDTNHVLLGQQSCSPAPAAARTACRSSRGAANRCHDGHLVAWSPRPPRRSLWRECQDPAPLDQLENARPLHLAPVRRAHPLRLRGQLPVELLLRLVRSAYILHRAGPGDQGDAVYATGRVLAGQTESLVRSELRNHAVQSAVAGICEGGQAMGRH